MKMVYPFLIYVSFIFSKQKQKPGILYRVLTHLLLDLHLVFDLVNT